MLMKFQPPVATDLDVTGYGIPWPWMSHPLLTDWPAIFVACVTQSTLFYARHSHTV